MTGGNPQTGEQVEGNLYGEVDFENRCFILSDRKHKPWIKVYWGPAIEGTKDNPTYTLNQIRRLKPGYYVAPVVVIEQSESAGGLKEASLRDLPYKDRPADFPKVPKKGGGQSGSRQYQQRNERIIVLQTCYKECAEMARQVIMLSSGMPEDKSDTQIMKELMDWVVERAKADADTLCRHGGVK